MLLVTGLALQTSQINAAPTHTKSAEVKVLSNHGVTSIAMPPGDDSQLPSAHHLFASQPFSGSETREQVESSSNFSETYNSLALPSEKQMSRKRYLELSISPDSGSGFIRLHVLKL